MAGPGTASDPGMIIIFIVSSHRMTASLLPGKAALMGRHKHGGREYLRTSPHRAVSRLPTCNQLRAQRSFLGCSVLLLHTTHNSFSVILVRSSKRLSSEGRNTRTIRFVPEETH